MVTGSLSRVAKRKLVGQSPSLSGGAREKTAVRRPALSRTVPWRAQDPVGGALAVQAPEKSLTKRPQKR